MSDEIIEEREGLAERGHVDVLEEPRGTCEFDGCDESAFYVTVADGEELARSCDLHLPWAMEKLSLAFGVKPEIAAMARRLGEAGVMGQRRRRDGEAP